MKSFRTAAVLACVLLALGGLATWDEWKTTKEETYTKSKNPLATIGIDKVNEITYWYLSEEVPTSGSAGPQEVHLVKTDGSWSLTRPIAGPADGAVVDSMIKSIVDYNYATVVSSDRASWKNFGLETPGQKITMKSTDGAEETFFFGSKAPVGFNSYSATSRSNEVLMGSQHITMAVAKTLYDLRDKSMIKIKEADLTAFSYNASNIAVDLVKRDGKYSYVNDNSSEPDGAYLKDFIEDLNFARVERYLDQPESELQGKFANPEVKVTFTFTDGAKKHISFLSSGDKLYASVEGATGIMELPVEFSRKVMKKPNDFRNRRIIDAESMAALSGVTIDGDYFKKIAGSWYSGEEIARAENPVKGAELAKESAHIRPFVVDLEFAKTEDFYALDQPDYAKSIETAPIHRIVLEFADSHKKTIELFKHELLADKYWVRVEGAATGYLVARGNFESISVTPPKAEALSPEG